jgi:hypothetical protein
MAAFVFGLIVAVAAIVVAFVQGFGLRRQAKRTGGLISAELASFDERAARTERLLAEAETATQGLEAAVARLRISRARLDVLLSALEAAQRRTRWLRALVPLR